MACASSRPVACPVSWGANAVGQIIVRDLALPLRAAINCYIYSNVSNNYNLTQNNFEKIRTYPDYGEYILGGGVIIFFIFASRIIWTSLAFTLLLLILLWFRVRLIKFRTEGITLLYPFKLINRKRTYTYDKVVQIQVMTELPNLYVGSAKIRFDLNDKRKIVLRYDSDEFKKIIALIGQNNFEPKVKVGTEALYQKAITNPKAKVIREYVPKR